MLAAEKTMTDGLQCIVSNCLLYLLSKVFRLNLSRSMKHEACLVLCRSFVEKDCVPSCSNIVFVFCVLIVIWLLFHVCFRRRRSPRNQHPSLDFTKHRKRALSLKTYRVKFMSLLWVAEISAIPQSYFKATESPSGLSCWDKIYQNSLVTPACFGDIDISAKHRLSMSTLVISTCLF